MRLVSVINSVNCVTESLKNFFRFAFLSTYRHTLRMPAFKIPVLPTFVFCVGFKLTNLVLCRFVFLNFFVILP